MKESTLSVFTIQFTETLKMLTFLLLCFLLLCSSCHTPGPRSCLSSLTNIPGLLASLPRRFNSIHRYSRNFLREGLAHGFLWPMFRLTCSPPHPLSVGQSWATRGALSGPGGLTVRFYCQSSFPDVPFNRLETGGQIFTTFFPRDLPDQLASLSSVGYSYFN